MLKIRIKGQSCRDFGYKEGKGEVRNLGYGEDGVAEGGEGNLGAAYLAGEIVAELEECPGAAKLD